MNLFLDIDLKRRSTNISFQKNSFSVDRIRRNLEIQFVVHNITSIQRRTSKIDIAQNKYRIIEIVILNDWSFLDEYIPSQGQYFLN